MPQSQPNRPYQRKRTVRNSLVPQSQQDRLYLKEVTQEGQNRVSKPTKSASPNEEHITKSVPQSQPHRPYQRKRTVRNSFVPQSQQDRLYRKEVTQKGIKIVPQGQQNRLYWRKRTAKIKLVPRGQQHRLHPKREQHKATKTSLEVTTNDLT